MASAVEAAVSAAKVCPAANPVIADLRATSLRQSYDLARTHRPTEITGGSAAPRATVISVEQQSARST